MPSEPAGTGSEGLDPGGIEIVGGDPAASPSGAGGTTPVVPATSVPSNGCGQAAALASGDQSLEVAGVTRTYVLDIPEAYTGSTPYPIVFAFHGATTSGQFFRSTFYGNLLSTMGDEAIVVHPDALGDPTAWNNQADVPFFDALVAELSSSLCIDRERVFATGHSSGGFFTNTLGCQRGDVLRAIAPVSAGGPFVFGGASCTGAVAVWLAHGENDETVTFDNGEASRDRWLDANACGETSAPISPEPCEEYSGCADGAPVRWCVYQDGHNWPDFAPEGIWEFFSSL
jgi:poly(3-hydroxybutyrate) depolymerase